MLRLALQLACGPDAAVPSWPSFEPSPPESPRLDAPTELPADPQEPDRPLAVTLDRPLFRPGETVWARIWDAADPDDPHPDVYVQLIDPHGASILSDWYTHTGAGASAAFDLEPDLPGGVYEVRATVGARQVERPLVVAAFVEEDGWTGSISREIPVLLDDLQLEWFPEGGSLVEGLPSRVYLRATDAAGYAVDLSGAIEDQQGRVVARFQTVHDGLGRFELTPRPGRTYFARLPSGLVQELVPARSRGCVLRTWDDLDGLRPELRVGVWCTERRTVVVTGSLAGGRFVPARVEVVPGSPSIVHLRAQDRATELAQGVARVTLTSDDGEDLAERLVYRNRMRKLEIRLLPERTRYGPREEVVLDVLARDAEGIAVRADIALSVVDDRLLTLAHDRHGDLPSGLLLARWITSSSDDPAWYFDPDEPDAGRGLDLVLGTRGWRRFVLRDGPLDEMALPRAAGPVTPDPEILGCIDKGLIDEVIQPRRNAMQACYRRQLRARPWLTGRLTIQFLIARDGTVTKVGTKATTMHHRPLETCVQDVFRQLRFPAARSSYGDVLVSYPIWFSPGDDPPPRTSVVREFAQPDYRIRKAPAVRSDFRPTVAWFPSVRTSAEGLATVRFFLDDTVTTFRISADGVANGAVGRAEATIESVLPIALDVPMPAEVSFGDRLLLPIRLTNRTEVPQRVGLEVRTDPPLSPEDGTGSQIVSLPPQGGGTTVVPLVVPDRVGKFGIEVSATAEGLADRVTRSISIAPRGSPVADDPNAPLRIGVMLDRAEMGLGETVRLTVRVENPTGDAVRRPVARIGLPAGVHAQTWQLDVLRQAGRIGTYETGPRELTLFWESAQPGEVREVGLDLVAELPGRFSAPPSSVYRYDTPDARSWTEGPSISIRP